MTTIEYHVISEEDQHKIDQVLQGNSRVEVEHYYYFYEGEKCRTSKIRFDQIEKECFIKLLRLLP